MTSFRPNASREHLLAGGASIRSSRPASVISSTTIDTLPVGTQPQQRYRGFPSEEAYLAALQDWADSKMHFENPVQLRGWYGTKTKEEYLNKTSIFEERRARKVEEKKEKERQRRETIARLGTVPEEGSDASPPDGERKESRLKRVFTRRATVA